MKILMLGCKEYPYGISSKYERFPGGGTARYVIGLAEELSRKGHEVHLIVRKFPKQKKYEKHKNLHIYRVPFINNKYLRHPTFSFTSYFKARKIIKTRKIDIIHTHGIFGATTGRFLKKKAPVIGTLHGVASAQVEKEYGKTATTIMKILQSKTYLKMDKICFLSESEKDLFFSNMKKNPKKWCIIHPGIKELKRKKEKNIKVFKVLFIGRLVPVKGLDKLINSFNFLPKKMQKNTEYIIVGNGYLKKSLIEQVKTLELEDKIKFAGFTENVYKYIAQASIFILPSEAEGMPCSLLEAMSMGTACIISNFEAPVDKNALVTLPNNNPKTIADQIASLQANSKLRKQMEINAKKEFQKNFSLQKFAENHIKEYADIIR